MSDERLTAPPELIRKDARLWDDVSDTTKKVKQTVTNVHLAPPSTADGNDSEAFFDPCRDAVARVADMIGDSSTVADAIAKALRSVASLYENAEADNRERIDTQAAELLNGN